MSKGAQRYVCPFAARLSTARGRESSRATSVVIEARSNTISKVTIPRFGADSGSAMSVDFSVDRVDRLTPADFFEHFVCPRRPVALTGGLKDGAANSLWSLDYTRCCSGDPVISVKNCDGSSVEEPTLHEYLDDLQDYESKCESTATRPAYLHDVSLTSVIPGAASDIAALTGYFPACHGALWQRFAQLLLSPSGRVTPLHFDRLRTHNLIFQMISKTIFTLPPPELKEYCYRSDWCWFEADRASLPFYRSYLNYVS
jgi:hypothetical protein